MGDVSSVGGEDNYKVHISFPRPVGIDEAERIVKNLAEKFSVDVCYEIHKLVTYSKEGNSSSLGGKILGGKIFFENSKGKNQDFTIINYNTEYGKELPDSLDTFWFSTYDVPKKDFPRHHSPEEIELFKNTNKFLEQYFKENPDQ